MYDVFVSYNSLDREAVEQIANLLRERGLTPYLDRWYLVCGQTWLDALEQPLSSCRAVAIFLGARGMGRWQQRERDLALDRQTRESSFPVIPVLLPGADPPLGFLSQNTWVDLREGVTTQGIEILVCAARGQAPGPDLASRIAATLAGICPYRGLRPFREEDEPFFCGREAFTNKLVEAVSRRNLIALVGASGSGKSSVVRAGLIPNLRRKRDCVWEFVTIRPQDRPLYNLAACLVPLLEPTLSEVDQLQEIAKLAIAMTDSRIELRDVIDRILAIQPGTDRLLLVVDQWEELYTLSGDDVARQRFIAQLIDAASVKKCSVILTLRADFYNHVVSNRMLSDRLGEGVVNIGPMTREELKQAIADPAKKSGLRFEDGLVGRILDDVGEEPGNLPLLEFLLTELWEKRHGEELELMTYEAIGGVRRAIAERAEQSFALLDNDAEREAARWALLALVVPGEGTADTRRRAVLNDLTAAERGVVAKLTADRLLVTTRDPAGRDVVEVGHEALIREWGRLRGWVNDDRDFLRALRRVEQDEASWQDGGRDPSLLLPAGRRIAEAEELLTSRPQQIGARIRAYIDASIAAEKERLEGLAAAQREKQDAIRKADRRVVVRTQIFGAAAIVLSVAVGISALIAQRERKIAEEQAGITIGFSKGVIEKTGGFLRSGAVLTKAVRELLGVAEGALAKLEKIDSTEALRDEQVSWLLTVSDVYVEIGDNETALSRALAAKQLLANAPQDRAESQRLLWGSYFRIGDALTEKGDGAAARDDYLLGLGIAERFSSRDPADPKWLDGLLFSHDKVGEELRLEGDTAGALKHYSKSIAVEERLLAIDQNNNLWRHRMSGTRNRIGDVYADQGDLNKALGQYREALAISKEIADREPDDLGDRLTLGVRYSRIGSTLGLLNDRAGALDALRTAMEIRKKLTESDPGNAQYQSHLASSLIGFGDFLLSDKEKIGEVIQDYREGIKIQQQLVEKDGANKTWQNMLAASQRKLTIALAGRDGTGSVEATVAK